MCACLGVTHPDYLELTEQQHLDWLEFWKLHGLPTQRRHDQLLATIAFILYNANVKKGAATISFESLLPYHTEKPELTPEQQLALIKLRKRIAIGKP